MSMEFFLDYLAGHFRLVEQIGVRSEPWDWLRPYLDRGFPFQAEVLPQLHRPWLPYGEHPQG